jgi:pimeloyl-ACP methyl ester carboxylesterase
MTTAHDDRGDGPAIILLHGFPFDRSMWREQVEFLASHGYRCVNPDLRGMGENNFGGEVASMADMARDVAALLEELGIDRVTVCGLSMGGYVAFEFVQLFPEKVAALILAGTRAPADNESEKAAREQQVATMLHAGMVPISLATLPKLLAPKTLSDKPEVVKRVRKMIVNSDPRGTAAAQRGMAARRDYVSDLPNITAPTLIIVGRDDQIRPVADAELMHERIPNSRLEVIEDAAHLTNLEQPEVFNATLLDFLGKFVH